VVTEANGMNPGIRHGESAERQQPEVAAERQRVQIEFSPEVSARLKEIKQLSDAKTNADVVRNAIRLFDWFLRQRQNGWQLQLVKGDTVREVEVIF
jgi:hypothetical protein